MLFRSKTRVTRYAAIAAGTLFFVAPLGPLLKDSTHSLPGNMDEGLVHIYPTLEWMRDKTPRTSYYLEPERKPEYGVLSDFTFGHWITAIGERPNFANPFSISAWHYKAIRESARLFLMEDETPLLAALDKNQIRYVLLYNSENAIADYALLTQRPLDEYLLEDPVTHHRVPTQRFFHTLAVRLALTDGSEYDAAGGTVPALQGFRLVHESPETRPRHVPGMGATIQASYVKLFERIKGAALEGKTDAGAQLQLSMTVTTNTGRRFEYRAHQKAGEDGKFRFVVPYSSEPVGDVTASVTTIQAPRCRIELALTEAEVVAGAVHPVRCK